VFLIRVAVVSAHSATVVYWMLSPSFWLSLCHCYRVWSRSTTELEWPRGRRYTATVGQVTIWLHLEAHAGAGLL